MPLLVIVFYTIVFYNTYSFFFVCYTVGKRTESSQRLAGAGIETCYHETELEIYDIHSWVLHYLALILLPAAPTVVTMGRVCLKVNPGSQSC